MKIATYNIWNSESGMPYRIKYIVNEIKLINADVICLQEVSSRKLAEGIATNADYPYWYFDNSQKIAVVNVHLPWDSVLDRILLQNTYPQPFPVLSRCNVFGTAIYEDIVLAAGDHYGVVVEME